MLWNKKVNNQLHRLKNSFIKSFINAFNGSITIIAIKIIRCLSNTIQNKLYITRLHYWSTIKQHKYVCLQQILAQALYSLVIYIKESNLSLN